MAALCVVSSSRRKNSLIYAGYDRKALPYPGTSQVSYTDVSGMMQSFAGSFGEIATVLFGHSAVNVSGNMGVREAARKK